ncbi:hypothetical protein BGX24_005212, partial [Mortierella sp. AD032]
MGMDMEQPTTPFPAVVEYLLTACKPTSYYIFRTFIIEHDSQDLVRFRQWVDWIVSDLITNAPGLDDIQKERVCRVLWEAKE